MQNSPEEASKPQLTDGRKQHAVNEAVKKLTGDAAQDRIQKEIHLFNCACIIERLLPSARVQGDSASIQCHVNAWSNVGGILFRILAQPPPSGG